MLPSIDVSAHTANIPPLQKVALAAIVGILAVVVYWQFVLRSEWAERSEIQAELQRLQTQAEQTRQIAGQRPRLEQETALLEAELQRAIQALPTDKEIPALLKRIAGLGQEADLAVALFKPGSPVTKEFYTEIPVQLKVMGTYHNLGLFFERLGRLERIVNVVDMTIHQATKGQRAGDTIQAELGVVAYFYTGTSGAKSDDGAAATQ